MFISSRHRCKRRRLHRQKSLLLSSPSRYREPNRGRSTATSVGWAKQGNRQFLFPTNRVSHNSAEESSLQPRKLRVMDSVGPDPPHTCAVARERVRTDFALFQTNCHSDYLNEPKKDI